MTVPSLVNQDPSLALSPDGRHIAYIADENNVPMLWVRSLQSAEARALQGTDGARQPFWSDDSRSIGFFTSTQLKTVSLETKSIAVLASVVSAAGRAWHGETIVYPEFYNWPALQGHDIRQLTSGRDHARSLGWPGRRSPPAFLPDGRHVLYFDTASRQIYTSDLQGGTRTPLTSADSGPCSPRQATCFSFGKARCWCSHSTLNDER